STEYDVQSYSKEKDHSLLELKAKNNSVAYDRLKMWVDNKNLVPTRIEAYAASGLLIKTLHYSKITDFGNGIVRPAMLETDSPLYKNYKSVMLFSKIQKRDFPDEVFTLNYLPRVESLR
ncbi:MAG: outer membrane lipoprotein-sorting protein, partial [Thioalkalispiraceae bacterium]